MTEPRQRHRACVDFGGIEHRKVAAIFACPPHHRQQPAIALDGILAAGHEHRLRNSVAGRQQIAAEAEDEVEKAMSAARGGHDPDFAAALADVYTMAKAS